MKARRKARALALQALYELDFTRHTVDSVLEHLLLGEGDLNAETSDFVRRLVHGVHKSAPLLDQLIHRHAPEWPLSQMAVIDRNILRLAIWEFAIDRQTPTKVAINEAVELAKMFGSDNAPRFVNGVLGTLAAHENDLVQALAKQARP